MVSGWKSRGGPETTEYQEIQLLGMSKRTSSSAVPGSSECRTGAAAGPGRKWVDGAQITGTNPAGNDFGIVLLRFKTADDAAGYAADVKTLVSACEKEAALDPSIAASFPNSLIPSKLEEAVSVEAAGTSMDERYALLPHGSLAVLITSMDEKGSASQIDALLKLELDKLTGSAAP
jgi:hypothetical protein